MKIYYDENENRVPVRKSYISRGVKFGMFDTLKITCVDSEVLAEPEIVEAVEKLGGEIIESSIELRTDCSYLNASNDELEELVNKAITSCETEVHAVVGTKDVPDSFTIITLQPDLADPFHTLVVQYAGELAEMEARGEISAA